MQWYIPALGMLCIVRTDAQYMTAICDVMPNPSFDPMDIGYQDIRGRVTFTQAEESSEMIQMSINLSGFSTIDEPSEHGFHVHQTGNISAGCEGAGAHFNPFNMTHGGPVDPERHVGDLGNIDEDVFGNVVQTKEDDYIKFSGKADIRSRALVIHETYDDLGESDNYLSNFTGNAGSFLACCVINSAQVPLVDFYKTVTLSVAMLLLYYMR